MILTVFLSLMILKSSDTLGDYFGSTNTQAMKRIEHQFSYARFYVIHCPLLLCWVPTCFVLCFVVVDFDGVPDRSLGCFSSADSPCGWRRYLIS